MLTIIFFGLIFAGWGVRCLVVADKRAICIDFENEQIVFEHSFSKRPFLPFLTEERHEMRLDEIDHVDTLSQGGQVLLVEAQGGAARIPLDESSETRLVVATIREYDKPGPSSARRKGRWALAILCGLMTIVVVGLIVIVELTS